MAEAPHLTEPAGCPHPAPSPLQTVPPDERPHEKLDRLGAASLTSAELLAIILRTGRPGCNVIETARTLLYGGQCETGEREVSALNRLIGMTPEEISGCPGIGPVKTRQVLAAIELGRRMQQARPGLSPDLSSPEAVVQWLSPRLKHQPTEEVWLLLADCHNRLIRPVHISRGGLTSAALHPRDVFREAIRANAYAVVLSHNHPSGDCTPSDSDVRVTRRLLDAGRMLGVQLNDHIIISTGGWCSLRRNTDIWTAGAC